MRAFEVDRDVQRDPPVDKDESPVGSTMASTTSWVTSRTAGRCRAAEFLQQQQVYPGSGERVQSPEGLVEEEELGFADQCSGERNPLRLSS